MNDRELLELIATQVGKLTTQVDGLTTQVGGLTEEMNDVKIKVETIQNTVIKIENDHGSKLDALFDGYKQNSEKLTQIKNEVLKHEEIIWKRVK